MKASVMVLLVLLCSAGPSAAQDFAWKGEIPTRKWLEIKGVNGDIRAVPAEGAEARVAATRDARPATRKRIP